MICDRHYLDSLCVNFAQFIYNGYIALHCTEYMLQKLGIQEDKVPELCVSLYKVYGTTMAGLKVLSISQLKLYINWRFFLFDAMVNKSPSLSFMLSPGNWLWLWLWWFSRVICLYIFVICSFYLFFILNLAIYFNCLDTLWN